MLSPYTQRNFRPDFDIIAQWTPLNAHVIDLGCYNGTLLEKLRREKNVTGYCVEINDNSIALCLSKGLNFLQQDLEKCLPWFEDKSFDIAILSLTLQKIPNTEGIIKAITRIAKTAIVSIPNFGFWYHRLSVLKGYMPVSRTLPHKWYNTPNIKTFTLNDFEDLIKDLNYKIKQRAVLHNEKKSIFGLISEEESPFLRSTILIFNLEK